MKIPQEIVDYIESCFKWDEDIKQEVYLAILEKPEGYEINKGWCQSTYENLRNRDARDERRHRQILQDNADSVRATFFSENQADDPSDVLSADELVGSRYAQLSPLVRKTLEMHYIQGMTIEDIAGQEWVDPNVIYKRLQRGREILKGETQ